MRVTLCSLAGLVVLFVISGAILYWKIQSIDLEQIQDRQLARAEGSLTQGAEDDPAVPKVMQGAVSKAEGIAGKSIKSEDALDVAAILLQSELSLKQMYDLIGQSSGNLDTAEKQRIRDTLLGKLKPQEIEALRAITTDYGKGLVILDPDYPIELVGVQDEVERTRIRKQLEAEKKAASGGSEPAEAASAPESDADQSGGGGVGESADPQLAAVAGKYAGKLQAVKAACTSDANAMTEKVIAAINRMKNDDGSSSAGAAEDTLVQEIGAVEASCEASFETVIRLAKRELQREGLSTAMLQAWRDEYAAAKNAAMAQARARISAAIG